jgi:hypothetical protein
MAYQKVEFRIRITCHNVDTISSWIETQNPMKQCEKTCLFYSSKWIMHDFFNKYDMC